ncbi:MAG: threonylcarbamoyl-AMP synthase [Deltaproteobacteria bacterium]|nr:threonylcarbamoyl-AMP synthase [Deltaproteobacteria bacterium]
MNGIAVAHAFPEEITFAVEAIRRGEVVAYPTETFYGLGVNALDELALVRLRQLKGRDGDKPISVLVNGSEMLDRLCSSVSPLARRLIAAYWPGPLTLALPARRDLPRPLVSDGFVAVRVSSHPTAQALVSAFGNPVTTTSANPAGEPPATAPEQVEEMFEGRCRVIHGGVTSGGAPTTLARVRGGRLEILRQGALHIEVD